MTDQAHALVIAKRLVALRKKSGLSQEGLADLLGVSRQAVSKWETGQALPETEKLMKLARVYSISLDALLKSGDGPAPAPDNRDLDSHRDLDRESDSEGRLEADEWYAGPFEDEAGQGADPSHLNRIEIKRIKKKRSLEEELIYGIALIAFLLGGFVTGKWHMVWLVFILAYFATLVLEHRRI